MFVTEIVIKLKNNNNNDKLLPSHYLSRETVKIVYHFNNQSRRKDAGFHGNSRPLSTNKQSDKQETIEERRLSDQHVNIISPAILGPV